MTGFCDYFGKFFPANVDSNSTVAPTNLPHQPWFPFALSDRTAGSIDRCLSVDRATEMDITMIGLQNAGKTSLLRVLAVSALVVSIPAIADFAFSGRRIHHRVSPTHCSIREPRFIL